MLPQGRIAMLFTDIEGSTSMVRELGPVYADVLRDERHLIRSAIAQFHGHEMGTEGDSFFVVFSTVEEALNTAVTAQRALAAHPWPGGGQVRVRMGLHAGEPARHEEGYVGLDLNRAARVTATAHGGQIVVSGELHLEAAGVPIRGLSFRDLGLHRLKDLPAPEHLYQVLVPDLTDITTPVKSLGAPSNLPGERNPLIGRDELVVDVVGLLHQGERLVTLIGAGGVGKTSAALRIAREVSGAFIDGVYFVALEHATTEADAWDAIVRAVESSSSEESPETTALDVLGARRVLLVLDNLEQLRAAAAVAALLLERTPAVLLATSRGALEVRGERPVVVPPLPVPARSRVGAASVDDVLEGPAVALFEREARRARPSFALSADNIADVAEVCTRLDGLPLAIELAAARIRLLSPKRLLESLSAQLWLQSSEGDRPDRQRTLRGAIEWSFELLVEPEQRWFTALALFEGGADIAAVEAIGPAVIGGTDVFTVVGELSRVGLVTLADAPDGGVRITMLTAVRELARSLLQKGPETDAISRLHARHYTELAEEAEVNLRGPHQLVWADRVTLEQANLAAAFEWASSGPVEDRALALRMASALGWFWYTHGRAAEGRTWLERALAGADGGAGPDVAVPIARAAHALGVLQQQQGENEAAARSFERALGLWRAAGQEAKIAQELNSLGVTEFASSEPVAARAHFEESIVLARRCGDEGRVASALSNLGLLALGFGSPDEAVGFFEEALRIDQRLANAWGEAVDRINLGVALARLDVTRAHTVLVDVLQTALELDDPDLVANTIEGLAIAAGTAGSFRHAIVLVAAADALRGAAAIPRAPIEDDYLERGLGPARAGLTEDEQVAARAEGTRLRGAELVAVASAPLVGRPADR